MWGNHKGDHGRGEEVNTNNFVSKKQTTVHGGVGGIAWRVRAVMLEEECRAERGEW